VHEHDTKLGVRSLAILLAGCTIEREVPIDRFACGSGGPCDAGMRMDAALAPDAMPVDTGVQDAGPPLARCLGIEPLEGDGLARGNTSVNPSRYEGGCGAPGGKEAIRGFIAPGPLASLEVALIGSEFDTVVHVYRDDCEPQNRITCNDNDARWVSGFSYQSYAFLEDLPEGAYAIVIDGFGPESGSYVLAVDGKIRPGGRCDPTQTFLSCEIGTCTDMGGVHRCPNVLDCTDDIDADDDGALDEDGATCVNPPSVTCPMIADPLVNDQIALDGLAVDEGAIVHREWELTEQPPGSVEAPFEPTVASTTLFTDLGGSYRIRYRVADDDHQLAACEVPFQPVIPEDLRVEVVWNTDRPHHEVHPVVLMHLLNPAATRWFDPILDCYAVNCPPFMPPDWGQANQMQDDPILFGLDTGPEFGSVATAENGRYALGVSYVYFGFQTSVSVSATIYCKGNAVQTLGPVILTNGNGSELANDFWKVAEIEVAGAGCQVTPFMPAPLIVTGQDASMSR
jgi:hypothetical protein